MVHIVEDWGTFADYAEFVKRGYYREIKELDDRVTIRAVAGRLGFEGEFDKDGEPLATLREFLKFHDFVRVERSVDADLFLR